MKKFWIILLILVVLALGVIVLIAIFSRNDKFAQESYTSGEGKISAIVVDVEDREVEVTGSPDEQIHIDYYESEKEYCKIFVSEEDELILTLVYNKNWLDYFGTKPSKSYRKISIQIPDKFLSHLQISTTNEKLKLRDISVADSVRLNSNGGDVEFENLFVGKQIDLTAKNGNIEGSIIGSLDNFEITCEIKKGKCNLPTSKDGGTKSLTANCNNGDININFVN